MIVESNHVATILEFGDGSKAQIVHAVGIDYHHQI